MKPHRDRVAGNYRAAHGNEGILLQTGNHSAARADLPAMTCYCLTLTFSACCLLFLTISKLI